MPALSAAPSSPPPTVAVSEKPAPRLDYPEISATLDGEELGQVYLVEEQIFLPMHSLCEYLGFALSFQADEAELSARIGELELRAEAGSDYMEVSGRYLYIPEGWVSGDGGLWLSLDAVCRLLGLEAQPSDGLLLLDAAGAKMLQAGADYYDIHFDMELTYWLPQIINAEAKGQPLEGMIGVGNVVMNRMDSELFPSKITSVLFDRQYAIQFEPVQNGSIKSQPCEEAYIASYLCLEGYNTVGQSLYFVNPAFGSGWFDRDLELYKVIGDHNFYVLKD